MGTIEEAIAALREGRPVLVADSPDRENEADVIFSADRVSTEWVAWTIRHSSGYLCAPMPAHRADRLALPLMVPNSQDPRRTAYTVTVDAAQGVTTGISAADRHRTLQVLADARSTSTDLIRPGHVLPLRAAAGGVLHRPGHTEAAVDLCRLAGVGEVAGIAELVRDDGTMMRLTQAEEFAAAEGLVLITIADLIAWRRAHDPIDRAIDSDPQTERVHRDAVADLPTSHGMFTMHGYRDLRTGAGHVALVPKEPAQVADVPLVRLHSECLTGDAFGSLRCDCGPQLHSAMDRVTAEGGAVVYLRGHEGRGIGLLAKVRAYALQDRGRDTVQANLEQGLPADRREFGGAAAILLDLGLTRIRLLTNNPAKADGLRAHGIDVTQIVPIEVGRNAFNAKYLETKRAQMGHLLTPHPEDGQS
ncbi:bifunctional 3,4-dihydroxy-2-butanone-4-phosphate synthase/GTP cyclohydrolase II [Rarobacter faecitabidus]|uniref:GTP cyclohydrolase-2 n=1 Tax=Rarobacter faecitabidus TaxID=13243 RepID=A0A542ZVL4_RARFA|nr:3,4-dihydroxy-2-butanone-4-phosphate synthase [Rarobacter faecitabidus]TQL64382.1 3,4-dihydroxy 2-butanone 4-phosphate synthase/GTP cyclohydrolase II [Rarobacter faecitabidus]